MRSARLAAVLLVLTGCGDPAAREQEKAFRGARKTLDAYRQALRSGDCAAAWACLTWKRREELPLETLQADYAQHRDRYYYRADAKSEDIGYDGLRVVLKLIDGEGHVAFVALLPEDGGWRIEGSDPSFTALLKRIERGDGPRHPEAGRDVP